MDRRIVLETLRAHQADLNRQGVVHAALFGSTARGDDRPDSDIDILVELDEEAIADVFAYAGLKRRIAELFDRPVDVVDRAALKGHVRDRVLPDAVYAF